MIYYRLCFRQRFLLNMETGLSHIFPIVYVTLVSELFVRTMTGDLMQLEGHSFRAVTDADVLIQPVVHLCSSPNSKYYLRPILGVLGTLLLYGVFLVLLSRKKTVHVEVLNDSRYIEMCIYNTVVLGVMGVLVCFSPRHDILIEYSFESAISILTTIITQSLIFAPKMKAALKNMTSAI